MNLKYIFAAFLLIVTSDAFAQNADNDSQKQVKKLDSNDTAADIKRLNLSPEDNLKAIEAEFIKSMAEKGYKVGPFEKGRKNAVNDSFDIPRNERLSGCFYPPSYSYPSRCIDDKNNIIFDSNKDDQKTLDEIIKAEGKQGKYNKLPKVRPVYKDTEFTITTVKEYPPPVIVPPPPSEDDDEEQQ